jgi:hypothetical protein
MTRAPFGLLVAIEQHTVIVSAKLGIAPPADAGSRFKPEPAIEALSEGRISRQFARKL